MTLGQSLWVGASDDLVLGPVDARMAMGGLLATNSVESTDIRTGILWSGRGASLLSSRSDLKVTVQDFHFVSTKGDGPYVGVNKTNEDVTVPAPPALGSKRIDLLWVRQEDKNAPTGADAATLAKFGVVTGTASSSPSKPALPAGSTEVGTITWDSTSVVASATNAAQCTLEVTCKWTVARGVPVPVRNAAERDDGTITPYTGMRIMRLDKGGLIQTYDGSTWRGQRTHAGLYGFTPDGSGYDTITHGAGFTPVAVVATWSGIALQLLTDSFTSSTFRVREIDSTGGVGPSSQSFSAVLYEAES